jgi:hypothetical protein
MVAVEKGNDEDVDFNILQFQKPKHVVQEMFTCFMGWGENTLRVSHFCSKKVMFNKYYSSSKLKS